MKKIYFSMTTHPNMNYDRSLRSVIWEQFPKLYRLYLNYLRDNPPLKSHVQLPPQTLLSLKQCAPDVIELAQSLRAEGRIKFMGTYLSESIAQCQDGMSVLDAAELGCGIASEELGADLEGFFLQEVAYTPQLPYVIDKLGVQWTIIRDWEGSLKPFWAEGLDGTRCVAVPLIEHDQRQRVRENPDLLPDNALLVSHCDMEIPATIKRLHELERYLHNECGFETEWCFVSDYLAQVGVEGSSFSAWWRKAKFGMFIHWGLYSAAARHEWIKNYEMISDEDYQKYFDHFDPDLYDPREWARAAREAGRTARSTYDACTRRQTKARSQAWVHPGGAVGGDGRHRNPDGAAGPDAGVDPKAGQRRPGGVHYSRRLDGA